MTPLAAYLKREGLSPTAFARRVGGKATRSHVHAWARGISRPRLANARAIERATKGAVTAAQMMGLA